tara:strand:- start:2207 stop:2869 length:663 start_codon:yes stop_codon:yes gene_type:complete
LTNIFFIILKKEIDETFNTKSKSWFVLAFFLLCIIIFPLSTGVSKELLSSIAIPAIWISAIFANLLALDSIFKEDYNDGTLIQYLMSGISLTSVVYAKCLNHWIFTGLPLILASPFCLLFLSESAPANIRLLLSLILGTPLLTLIGLPISALTLGVQTRGPILAFVTLPFYLPVIIFGVISASRDYSQEYAEFYLMAAMLSLSILFLPLLTVKIIKFIMD